MERLTTKREWSEASQDMQNELGYSHIWKRLNEIEDIFGDDYDLDRIRELVNGQDSAAAHGKCPVCDDYDKFANIVCYDGETGQHIQLKYCPHCGAKMDDE